MAKSSKSAKSERQKVIDDIRRKQKNAEKRQGMWIVGVCVAIALAIVVFAAWQPAKEAIRKAALSGKSIEEIGAGPDVCQDVTSKTAAGSQEHVEPEQVQYPIAPPAFGPHWNLAGEAPAPVSQRFYSAADRPELEALVHNLEHGYTILWYDASAADDGGELANIQKIADLLDVNDTNGRYKFKAVPWTAKDEAEAVKAQKSELATAQQAVSEAKTAITTAKKKADKRAAQKGLASATKKLKEAQSAAEVGGSFPKGQHIALTHWTADNHGKWQYCSEVSGEALKDFMFDYPYSDSTEPDGM